MKIGKIKFSICTFQFAISNIITLLGGTGAPRQWTPRANGRLASMDVSRQWTPRVNGRPRLCLQLKKIKSLALRVQRKYSNTIRCVNFMRVEFRTVLCRRGIEQRQEDY
ncbi:MAG: hypothetical protein AUJ18_07605 [Candidatus Hydrogenedentes bacterium CG1_02_42_14]|nr:MAG: hypothetical protein AUJ18_07605 [Candidatus Hydrogenedentes bacterium CG1_02_42_14]